MASAKIYTKYKNKKAQESPQIEVSFVASSKQAMPLYISQLVTLLPSSLPSQFFSVLAFVAAVMAITHDSLSLRKKFHKTDISSKLALFLVIFSILFGIAACILCLAAEGSRSEVTWLLMSAPNTKDYTCYYSGSGRIPMACTVAALLLFAAAMFSEHAYILMAVMSPQPPALVAWATVPQGPRATATSRDLSCQACCLFLTTWVFFAISEVLLMIGIGIESGHLSNWTSPRATCHAIKPGVFAVAGVSGLITVFLGVGLYITALRTQKLHLEEENARRQRTIPEILSQYPHVPPSTPEPTQSQPRDKILTAA